MQGVCGQISLDGEWGGSGFLATSDCALLSHRHDLIKKLFALKDTNSELAGLLLEQVVGGLGEPSQLFHLYLLFAHFSINEL